MCYVYCVHSNNTPSDKRIAPDVAALRESLALDCNKKSSTRMTTTVRRLPGPQMPADELTKFLSNQRLSLIATGAGWCLVVLTLGWPSSITSDAFTVAGMLGQHGRRQPAKGFPPRLSQPIQSLPPRADPAGRSCYPSAVIINRKNNQCAKCPLKHAHLSLSARPHGQQILC